MGRTCAIRLSKLQRFVTNLRRAVQDLDTGLRGDEAAAAMSPSSTITAHDPYRSVAREVLCVLADEDRPMSLRELQGTGRIDADDAAFQLSIARVAGFVRSVPVAETATEPAYRPTTLGWMIARRTRAHTAAQELRRLPEPVAPLRLAA